MKSTKNIPAKSAFFQSASTLDESFTELTNLSLQLEAADLETEYGMNHAKKILLKFGECGERLGGEIQALAQQLQESRQNAETAAQKVGERAAAVQKRHEENEAMLARFRALGASVHQVTTSIIPLDDNGSLVTQIPGLVTQLEMLFEESVMIKNDAKAANMKTLERDAASLGQMLTSARAKLSRHAIELTASVN